MLNKLKQLPAVFRILLRTSRNPASLSAARLMFWLWTIAALMAIFALGGDVMDGSPTWWWLPIQTSLLVLDVTMARASLLGYLRAREARNTDREFRRITTDI